MLIDAKKTLLLIIDVQNDFCPAYICGTAASDHGALAVKNGNDIVFPLNSLSRKLTEKGGRAAATQDWHPKDHVSFASSHKDKKTGDVIDISTNDSKVKDQYLWPDHCVQGTKGADLHGGLDLSPVSMIIRKGFRKELDSYSAFFENDRITPTGLEGWIRFLGIETVIMGGLATDYCVFYSAMDCKKLGFYTIVASDVVRGVGIPPNSIEAAIEQMKDAGIDFISSEELEWI